MGLARASVEWLAIRAGDSKTGNCDRLAPAWIPVVLEMGMPPSTGPTFGFARGHGSNSQNEPGQSALGRTSRPRRAVETRIRAIGSNGCEVYGPSPETPFSDVAHLLEKPHERYGCD